jgi:hypothetical protein
MVVAAVVLVVAVTACACVAAVVLVVAVTVCACVGGGAKR